MHTSVPVNEYDIHYKIKYSNKEIFWEEESVNTKDFISMSKKLEYSYGADR
jgi:hypothetical protein